MLESEQGTFFELGDPKPNASDVELLTARAGEIGKLPNRIYIEGHTDAKPYGSATYSNWELSVDRANAARRIMQSSGVGTAQVLQVRGYADQQLRNAKDPEDAANRRITLIVRYQESAPGEAAAEKPPAAHGEAPAHERLGTERPS